MRVGVQTRILAAAVGALLLGPAAAAQSPDPAGDAPSTRDGEPSEERALAILEILGALREAGGTTEEGARAVANLGPDWAPALFELLEREGPEGGASLRPADRRILARAMGSWGRSAILPLVEQRALAAGGPDLREELLIVLAHIGRGSDLRLAARIASSRGEVRRLTEGVSQALEEAAREILIHDPGAIHVLRELLLSSEAGIGSVLARGAGGTDSIAVARTLSILVGVVPFSDRELLASVARIGRYLPRPVDPDVADAVRACLLRADPGDVREAARTLAALEDHDAVGLLIELLDHEESSVRTACLAALRGITGRSFPEDRTRWLSWFRLETQWLTERATNAFADLDHEDAPAVAGAIREITSHALHRPLLARELERVLRRREPLLRRLACLSLGQLGGRDQIEVLVEMLGDPNEIVVDAAQRALRMLTGESFGADVDAWNQVLDKARGSARSR